MLCFLPNLNKFPFGPMTANICTNKWLFLAWRPLILSQQTVSIELYDVGSIGNSLIDPALKPKFIDHQKRNSGNILDTEFVR
jgi:hypothetical protein